MPADVFDEQRRAWIKAHAGHSLIQKRRAQELGKELRQRARERTGAAPDPHDDDVTPRIIFRKGNWESGFALAAAVLAPIGWLAGWALYKRITTLIPETLRAYPIPALVWAAIPPALVLLYLNDPAPDLWSSAVVPWLLAQLPATFLSAGAYGYLEGWLAVDGSSQWWPIAPIAPEVDDNLLFGSMELPMPTLLDPDPAPREPMAITHRPTTPRITWFPLISGAAIAAALTGWFVLDLIEGLFGPSLFSIF